MSVRAAYVYVLDMLDIKSKSLGPGLPQGVTLLCKKCKIDVFLEKSLTLLLDIIKKNLMYSNDTQGSLRQGFMW